MDSGLTLESAIDNLQSGIMERRIWMPKLKTHRGAAKRIKVTGSGKFMRSKAYRGHLLTGKPAKRMRRLKKGSLVPEVLLPNLRKMLPYS